MEMILQGTSSSQDMGAACSSDGVFIFIFFFGGGARPTYFFLKLVF